MPRFLHVNGLDPLFVVGRRRSHIFIFFTRLPGILNCRISAHNLFALAFYGTPPERGGSAGEPLVQPNWGLHKFRATYITSLLRAGIDAWTVMKYSGHEDLETILRYLAPAEGAETQAKVSAIVWTK